MLYGTYKMTSLRRSLSVVQRDGSLQNGDAAFDISSPPKLPYNRSYFDIGRLLNSLSNSLDFRGAYLPRSIRSGERSKPKGIYMKRSCFHYFICFMIGIFVSFTPFFSIDISTNLATKQHASFENGVMVDNTPLKIDSVQKENLHIDKPLPVANHSLEVVEKLEAKSEALDASHEIPSAYVKAPFQDVELVPQKLLIIVTPTYERPFQAYCLNRLAHTLRTVPPPLLWIVVEMSSQSTETAKILRENGVMYRHLVWNPNATSMRNREVHQRNVALIHIKKHRLDGIVHFADDDRVYSVDIFDQMRQIRRLGTWPVATLTESRNRVLLEGPVCNGSQVIGWHTNQRSKSSRRFLVDMSGFAFNSSILWDAKGWHRPTLEPILQHSRFKEGLQESAFVEQLVEDESQMEGFPTVCSKIMVWHLHLEAPELLYAKGWSIQKNLEVVATLA